MKIENNPPIITDEHILFECVTADGMAINEIEIPRFIVTDWIELFSPNVRFLDPIVPTDDPQEDIIAPDIYIDTYFKDDKHDQSDLIEFYLKGRFNVFPKKKFRIGHCYKDKHLPNYIMPYAHGKSIIVHENTLICYMNTDDRDVENYNIVSRAEMRKIFKQTLEHLSTKLI